ncbi:MAG TPA: hypothetical protein VFS15_23860, partial [Kofleriaceae bacterium]|nr:hypothetical protein [Kofleriaceae bacterium]
MRCAASTRSSSRSSISRASPPRALALKAELDDWLDHIGWGCRLTIKVHVGTVIVGPFNGVLDVIGREVNTAAMLDSTGVALSVAAFRALG